MMRLIAAALAVAMLQASATLAGSLREGLAQELPAAGAMQADAAAYYATRGPSLNSSEVAAIQYHEPAVSSRCQTRAGVFAVSPSRPVDTRCVVDGLPGVMLP